MPLFLTNKMRLRFALSAGLLAVMLALLAAGGGGVAAQPAGQTLVDKVSPLVQRAAARGGQVPILVSMSEQANLSAAYTMRDQSARGWYVYNTLHDLAERSQASLRAYLAQRGVQYESFWIANALSLQADQALIDGIASRADVAKIESDESAPAINEPAPVAAESVNGTNTVEWGVANVNAPQVWALGYTGQGIVVGGSDTGIRWSQEALKPHYRGWNGSAADHNYNWYDGVRSAIVGGSECGYAAVVPCDDYFHGSHTIGSAVGGVGSNEIGVAPGAEWIGCRNMDQGVGRPSSYINCFQFMTAPTDLSGNNPNPDLRAHIVTNSWGCPPDEQCTDPNVLKDAVESTQAAGIFVASSAGNEGPNCSSVGDPPAIYALTFAAGAYDSSNILASLSSRGPVTADGSGRLKPNITGPGVNVRSASNGSDTEYTYATGTSMASPHVAGVVALLWSAHPELSRQITETKTLLEQSASHDITNPMSSQVCGGTSNSDIPNNQFGYGRVDALAAVEAAGPVNTATPTATGSVPTATRTATPVPPTATYTRTPVPPTATHTPVGPTVTNTVPASTATPTSTVPAGSTVTSTATVTPKVTPTACSAHFSDVNPTDYFAGPVSFLACGHVISGYADGTFKPYNNVTRGQLAKFIVLGMGWNIDTTSGPHFRDVLPGSPFYDYVETLFHHLIIIGPIGYDDLTFRPNNPITRGQLAKLVVLAKGWTPVNPPTPTFSDVPTNNAFYIYIETIAEHGLVSGYGDGTYRWANYVIRGQAAKIIYWMIESGPTK